MGGEFQHECVFLKANAKNVPTLTLVSVSISYNKEKFIGNM